MGLFRRSHASTLRAAQDLWDDGRLQESVARLEAVLPRLRPRSMATDALIVATLATYISELGDPRRGLELLARLPLDGVKLTDVHLICLGARCCCRVAAGDLAGARRDRATIHAADPRHPALVLADSGLSRPA